MSPQQDRRVFLRVRVGPKRMGRPGVHGVWCVLTRRGWRVDRVDGQVGRRRPHGTTEDAEGFVLLEMYV